MNNNTSKKIFVEGCEKAVQSDTQIDICVKMHNSLGFVDDIGILFNKYGQLPGEEMQGKLSYDSELSTDEWSCFKAEVVFHTVGYRTFYFSVVINGVRYALKYDQKRREAVLADENADYPFFDIFVYKDFSTPDWVKGGIMYQIYVDTFYAKNIPESVKHKVSKWGEEPKWKPDEDGEYRNDKFFGGNFEGIIEKIPHLKSLGVTIAYLTPIFSSETSNRYSTVNYEMIDEMIGDWETAEKVENALHENGMRMIFDLVLNHCSPNNWLYQMMPEIFTGNFWWGYKDMAEFDTRADKYRAFLAKLLRWYLRFCDGIRLDVADNMSDDILKFIMSEVKVIEKELDKKIEVWILGEVWHNAVTGAYREFIAGSELHSVMNYQFMDAIYRYIRWGDHEEFRRKVFDSVLKLYPKPVIDVLMNPLSTHDTPRIPNILTNELMLTVTYLPWIYGEVFIWDYDKLQIWNDDNGKHDTLKRRTWEYENNLLTEEARKICENLEKLLVFLQYTLPGIPSIFAGDEFGMTGMKDPFNRACVPWDKIDHARLETYKTVGKFRMENREIFAESECKLVYIDSNVFIYERMVDDKKFTFAINRTPERMKLDLEGEVIFTFKGSDGKYVEAFDAIVLV